MTKKEYIKKMKADGFVSESFLGYWKLPGTSTSVSDLNAGDDYSAKYQYMRHQLQKRNQTVNP